MIGETVAEFVGALFFVGVILMTGGDPVQVGIGLAAALLLVGKVSGGHLNPAVSTAMLAKGKIGIAKYALYVVAQVLGALTAVGLGAISPAG